MTAKFAQEKRKRLACQIVFALYILVLLYLTVFRFNFYYPERQLNLTLFIDLISIYRNGGIGKFLWLFLGNIVWFVPCGFFLPLLWGRKIFSTMALGLAFSFCIEIIQFISCKGVAELDDLILNTLGTVIGYLLFKLSYRIFSKKGIFET